MEKKTMTEEMLINENARFVQAMAKRYLGNGLDIDELIKAGMDGLTVAAQNYDTSRGFKFMAYAVWYVKQGILLALSAKGNEDGRQLYAEEELRQQTIREFDASLRTGKISEEVANAIEALPDREKGIILHSYGFGFESTPDAQICEMYGVTMARLMQIRSRVMIRLRKQFIETPKA